MNNTANERTSLRDIARRVSRRSIDLVAIALVAAAGLSLGRQVLQWWGVEPDVPSLAAGMETLAEVGGPVSLEFGDRPLRLTRRTFAGERQGALRVLLEACRNRLEEATLQAKAWTPTARTPTSDPAEQQLLAHTARLRPIEEQPGSWQIYQVDLPFIFVVGIVTSRTEESVAETPHTALPAPFSSATPAADRHVISWGIMLPHADNAWTLYTFDFTPDMQRAESAAPEIPLPPSSRRLISLTERRGGRFVGVAGEGTPEEWQRFYENWFQMQGWKAVDGWRIGEGHRAARFRQRDEAKSAVVDVQFGADERGETSGVVCTTPAER